MFITPLMFMLFHWHFEVRVRVLAVLLCQPRRNPGEHRPLQAALRGRVPAIGGAALNFENAFIFCCIVNLYLMVKHGGKDVQAC